MIAAGGTAGHVVPALAVARELSAAGALVEFIGADRAESELVPEAGYALHSIVVRGLSRSDPREAIAAGATASRAALSARTILGEVKPDAVLGAGGYVAGVVGAAALSRRIPLVLAEADSHVGLSNRILAPFARAVCLAFEPPGGAGRRAIVTGRPVDPPFTDRAAAREALGLPADGQCVLVSGGSLGARSINEAALAAFADAPYHVLHVSGRRDYSELEAQRPPGYDLREYLDRPRFAMALAACDLAVGRSGGSVFELAAQGLPSILVPYPAATADHQSENARWLERGGAAVVIDDGELTAPRLRAAVDALLADPARLERMGTAALALARPDAASRIARVTLAAAR